MTMPQNTMQNIPQPSYRQEKKTGLCTGTLGRQILPHPCHPLLPTFSCLQHLCMYLMDAAGGRPHWRLQPVTSFTTHHPPPPPSHFPFPTPHTPPPPHHHTYLPTPTTTRPCLRAARDIDRHFCILAFLPYGGSGTGQGQDVGTHGRGCLTHPLPHTRACWDPFPTIGSNSGSFFLFIPSGGIFLPLFSLFCLSLFS